MAERAEHLRGLFQIHAQLQPRAYDCSAWSASTPEQAQSDSSLYQRSLRLSLDPEVLKMAVQTSRCHVLTPQNPKLVEILVGSFDNLLKNYVKESKSLAEAVEALDLQQYRWFFGLIRDGQIVAKWQLEKETYYPVKKPGEPLATSQPESQTVFSKHNSNADTVWPSHRPADHLQTVQMAAAHVRKHIQKEDTRCQSERCLPKQRTLADFLVPLTMSKSQ